MRGHGLLNRLTHKPHKRVLQLGSVFRRFFFTQRDVIGAVVGELTVAASVPDYDLWLQFYDVAPDGTAWNLSAPGTALLRASYRQGGPLRALPREGEISRLRFDRLVTATRILPGHRLRIVLSAAFFPLFSVNPQTGLQEFDTDKVRAGDLRVQHSRAFPSRVLLPVVPIARD